MEPVRGGHVFVVNADLNYLACDAVGIPTDRARSIRPCWHATVSEDEARSHDFKKGGSTLLLPPTKGRSRWLLNVARPEGKARTADIEAVVHELACAFRSTVSEAAQSISGSCTPIIAIPLLGTGGGGAGAYSGEICGTIVAAAREAGQTWRCDFALVAKDQDSYAALQAARRQTLGDLAWEEPHDRAGRLQVLAGQARAGRLVAFLGAGVSQGAGLPDFKSLLGAIGAPGKKALPKDLPAWAKRIAKERFDGSVPALHAEVARMLRERALRPPHAEGALYSLGHALVAGLRLHRHLTTNYDDLLERACEAIGHPIARIPAEAMAVQSGWVVKLHGHADLAGSAAPEGMVITSSDYEGFTRTRDAFGGFVQATLLADQILFLGYSHGDPNLAALMETAAKKIPPGAVVGTAFALGDPTIDPSRGKWRDHIQWEQFQHKDGLHPAIREWLMALDRLSASAAGHQHLLDPRFDGLLSDEDRSVREIVSGLERVPRGHACWKAVDRFLDGFRLPDRAVLVQPVLGLDLAWSDRHPTGFCVVAGGRVVESGRLRGDSEIAALVARLRDPDLLVAVDSPLVVKNSKGQRACEREIGRVFGKQEAPAHSTNLSRAMFEDGGRAMRLARRCHLNVDPSATEGRRMIEVYPHPALVRLFCLDKTLKYKDGKGRSLETRRLELETLLKHLLCLAQRDPPLDVAVGPRWWQIWTNLPSISSETALKSIEDEVDAHVCAYVGQLHNASLSDVIGDVEDGYIVIPRSRATP